MCLRASRVEGTLFGGHGHYGAVGQLDALAGEADGPAQVDGVGVVTAEEALALQGGEDGAEGHPQGIWLSSSSPSTRKKVMRWPLLLA